MFILNHWFVQRNVQNIVMPYLTEYSFSMGNMFDSILPDIKGRSHGYDMKGHSGNLVELIREYYFNILNNVRQGNAIDKDVYYLIHYITDAMTIGQISGTSLWGKKDDAIDFASDYVLDKHSSHAVSCFAVSGFMEFNSTLFEEMDKIYIGWLRPAKQWTSGFLWPFRLTPFKVSHYTRSSLRKAIQLSCVALCTIDRELYRNG